MQGEIDRLCVDIPLVHLPMTNSAHTCGVHVYVFMCITIQISYMCNTHIKYTPLSDD